METLRGGAASVLIGLATAFAIVAVVLPLFLNPLWVSFEQGRAQATAWTGFTEPELRGATDAILADLALGPPEFDVAIVVGAVCIVVAGIVAVVANERASIGSETADDAAPADAAPADATASARAASPSR